MPCRAGDVRLGFLKFRLREFDDGTDNLSSWHKHS